MNSDDKGDSFTHIEFQAGAVGRKGLMHLSPVLTPEYLLPFLFVPGSLFLFTSATGRTGVHCSYCTKVWFKPYPICDAPLSRLAQRSFVAPSQKSRRYNRFCLWTEALSSMIFLAAQKLSGAVRT